METTGRPRRRPRHRPRHRGDGPLRDPDPRRPRGRRDQGRAPRGRQRPRWPRRRGTPAWAHLALNVNRNKRSVALDLKSAAGQAAFTDLVAHRRHPRHQHAPRRPRPARGLDHAELARDQPAPGLRQRAGLPQRLRRSPTTRPTTRSCRPPGDDRPRCAAPPAPRRYVPTILADKVCALTIAYSVLAARGPPARHRPRPGGRGADGRHHARLHPRRAPRRATPSSRRRARPASTGRSRAGHAAVADRRRLGVHPPLQPAQHHRLLRRRRPRRPRRRPPVHRPRRLVVATRASSTPRSRRSRPTRTTDDWAALCAEHSHPVRAGARARDRRTRTPTSSTAACSTSPSTPARAPTARIGFPVPALGAPRRAAHADAPPGPGHRASVLRELGRTDEQIAEMTS